MHLLNESVLNELDVLPEKRKWIKKEVWLTVLMVFKLRC
jgi:hypothetical protein